jgi:hypothetical protein
MTKPRTFRKKPVEIQAMQVLDDLPSVTAIADWIVANGGSCTSPLAFHERRETALRIKTLEGVMDADLGDWIIRGVKGEFYPCKPDIFEQTYVDAAAAPPAEATRDEVRSAVYWGLADSREADVLDVLTDALVARYVIVPRGDNHGR